MTETKVEIVRDFSLVETDKTVAIHRVKEGKPEPHPVTLGLTQLSFVKRHQAPGVVADTTFSEEERRLVHVLVNAMAGL